MVALCYLVLVSLAIVDAQPKWQKILLTDAVASGARCLDGSPGGFYYRPGSVNNWIVFHQGGGWCVSDADCYQRSLTALGSSTGWGPTYNDTYEANGLFSQPPFDEWNLVYAMYCDGGSWAAEVEQPVKYQNYTIYYRGRPLLDALIDKLLAMGLKDSKQTIFGGCSAGGLTSYMHADYFASRMPKTMDVAALADAWFAHDSLTFQGQPNVMELVFQWIVPNMNVTRSIPAPCLSRVGPANAWQCWFGANLAADVQTPMFVFNSKYDPIVESIILNLTCDVTQCKGDELNFWINWGNDVVKEATALPARHGVFLTNCPHHCDTGTDGWKDVYTGKVRLEDAFKTWFDVHTQAKNLRWFPSCNGMPCPGDKCS